MTILAITNPMGTQQQPQSVALQNAVTMGALRPAGELAVQPTNGAGTGGNAGSATAYSGFGAGAGGAAAQGFGTKQSTIGRPSDATSGSVVGAQAATDDADKGPKIVNTAQRAREMAAAMPDPLPTSPFLRMIEGGPAES